MSAKYNHMPVSYEEQFLRDFVIGAKAARKEKKLKAASVATDVPGFIGTDSPGLGSEMEGFRRLTGFNTRMLPVTTQERMLQICYWLWKTNPLANWLIEIVKDFVVSEGLPFSSQNEDVMQVIKDFWEDPINQMDIYLEKYVRELGIYGEQCWPVYVGAQTGKVKLGYVDPANLRGVETDPLNVKIKIGVVLKSMANSDGKKYKIILDPEVEAFLSPEAQGLRKNVFTDGECFYFSINNVTNEPRGTSDLFVISDHLDGYEQFIFDYIDRWPMLNSFIWDVTLDGADENAIRKFLEANPIPKPGSVRAHNEKVKWAEISPNLQAAGAEEGSRVIRNHILGSRGIPEFWFGGGGKVNRSTAAEMGLPAFKMISARQKTVKHILQQVFRYVIRMALDAAYLRVPEVEAYKFDIHAPEIDQADISKLTAGLQSLSVALTAAQVNNWIDEETGRKIFAFAMKFIGYEYDPADIADKINEQKGKEGYEDYTGD